MYNKIMKYKVTGNTYAIKDQLKNAGAAWVPDGKYWLVPEGMRWLLDKLAWRYSIEVSEVQA